MSENGVTFSTDAGIAHIVLDRPDAGNAIDLKMAAALTEVAQHCEADEAIRCVVLTGAGKLFCAGGDVLAMCRAKDRSAFLHDLAGQVHIAVASLMRMEKPLITLVNGAAAGAGLSLAVSGDVVLAARSASFATAYRGVGLTPDGGMSWLLPRLVGMREALRMLILGEKVSAERAEATGLLTRIVDDEALAVEGQRVAERLAAGPTKALGGARALLLAAYENDFSAHLDREAQRIAQAAATGEAAEGIADFSQRRKPRFTGKE